MAELKTKESWFSRHWKMALACSSLVIVMLGLTAIGLFVHFFFGLFRNSDVVQQAMVVVREDVVVQQELGTPIEIGYFTVGNMEISGPSGYADISIPISGPKGEAKAYVIGERSAGKWTLTNLEVKFEEGRRVDLLEGSPGRM